MKNATMHRAPVLSAVWKEQFSITGVSIRREAALAALARVDAHKAHLVELRYFMGLSIADTARALGVDPHDWRENLDGSARYLALMLAEFGDIRLALAAYNAGPDAVRAHGGIPPFQETHSHVQRVLAVLTRLEG